MLLAVARGLGETAPLLLTIFGNQYMQWNPTKPMNALPLVIFNNSSQPYADLVQMAWGAALLLMVVVLVAQHRQPGRRLRSCRGRRR